MKSTLKLLAATSVILLSGCSDMGQQASFADKMSDNFAFTEATSVPASEARCVTLTKSFELQAGSVTYTLPAGTYTAREKNSTGYYYYAPSEVKSSSWLDNTAEGIYLTNQLNQGNLFIFNPLGYDARPIRNAVLPNSIFSIIKKNSHC